MLGNGAGPSTVSDVVIDMPTDEKGPLVSDHIIYIYTKTSLLVDTLLVITAVSAASF